MKIYPNKLNIKIKNEVNTKTDIQLAYVDTTSSKYNVNTVIDNKYKEKKNEEVLPYDKVDTSLCLFNKDGTLIDYDSMLKDFVKDGKTYTYIPRNNSISFIPKQFEYYIRAKKAIKYMSNNIYNIKTHCNDSLIANNLMPIFGDAKDRKLAPNNILINNGDLSIQSLLNNNINDSDITFIQLKDFNTIINNDTTTSSWNKKYWLDNFNTTLICVVKSDESIKDYDGTTYSKDKINLLMHNVTYKYTLSNSNIYKDSVNLRYYFNIPKNTIFTKYYSIFNDKNKTPILIEVNINNNMVIYITEELIYDIKKYYKFIYEIILYGYLNGYKKSSIYTHWITDEVPNYIVEDNKLLTKIKNTSKLTPSEMLDIPSNSYKYLNVIIDTDLYPYVKYDGLYNNYLSFSKIKGNNNEYIDPQIKPDNYISVYSNDEIFYYKEFIYKINDNIEDCINIQINKDNIIIETKDFRYSDEGIYIKQSEPFIIPLYKENNEKIEKEIYYLIYNSLTHFELVKKDIYKEGKILVTFNIEQDENNKENILFDMRQRGGGLPKTEKDNYDCFDIGNIYGRPYRKGGSLIITLPKYLEKYKDEVMSIVKQYMLADDYPIILFEEESKNE